MLVFVSEAECVRRQEAIESLMSRSRAVLPLVHPQRHLMAQSLRTAGLRDLLSALPHAFTAALKGGCLARLVVIPSAASAWPTTSGNVATPPA